MKMSEKGLKFLINNEGVCLESYKDSVGIWTIGIGHTSAASGSVTSGMLISIDEAFDLFKTDIIKFERRVNEAIKFKTIEQNEFDALVSFDFNTGGIYKAKTTKYIRIGKMVEAGKHLMGWLRPKSIKTRRQREQDLFLTGNYFDTSKYLLIPVRNNKPDFSKSKTINY